MTAPLDEKGLEAAKLAWTGDARLGLYPEQEAALIAAIRAYLSAVALPDELEVVDNLRSDAAQLLRMSEATKFGEDLSVRVTKPDLLISNMVAAADALSQAHSTIAALRAERDRLMQERDALAKVIDPDDNRPALMARIIMASVERLVRAETAEAEVKRLTEENEALERHNQALLDKVSSEDCACAYDHPDDVCLGHSPKLKAAEARIKALEEALSIASHALMVVQVAIDEDTTALNDVLWVPERFSPNESLLDFVGNARARAVLNSREKVDD